MSAESDPSEQPAAARLWASPLMLALIVFLVALLVRGLLLAARIQDYQRIDAQGGVAATALGGSDVPGYLGMANYLRRDHDLGYWLMGARPPLFPLTVALVRDAGGSLFDAAALQVVFGALTAAACYLLARSLLAQVSGFSSPERFAFLAGIVMALDPASVSASAALMTEPLFNLAFTGCITFLAIYIHSEKWPHLALSAISLAAAMLARPTAIYFWIAAALIVIPLMRRWWRPALALALTGLVVYAGWSARNLRYTGVFTYSTQTNFSLLFLRGLSAEHLATGAPIDDLYVQYVQQLYDGVGDTASAQTVTPDSFWDFLVAPSPQLYAEMGRMARQKLLAFWPYVLVGTGIAAFRMFAYTNSFPAWFIPIEVAYNILLYALMLFGAWRAFKDRSLAVLLVCGIPILYVTGLTFASQISAMDTRMRTPISAPISVLAVYGLHAALGLWRSRRAAQPRPSV